MRTHFVPVGYLKFFTGENGSLQILDKMTGRTFSNIPKNVGYDTDLYAIKNEDQISNDLEAIFGEEVEAPGYEVIRELENSFSDITPSSKISLSKFLGLLMVRGPSFRDEWNRFNGNVYKGFLRSLFRDPVSGQAEIDKLKRAGYNVPNISAEEMIEFIRRDEFSIEDTSNLIWLRTMLHSADFITQCLLKSDWIIIKAPPGKNFFTCDRPCPMSITDLLSYNAIPLTKGMALSILPIDTSSMYRVTIRNEQLEDMNKKIKQRAKRFLYSSSNENL